VTSWKLVLLQVCSGEESGLQDGAMEFEITHLTNYQYGHPAAEAYGEARLTPPNLDSPDGRQLSPLPYGF